MKITKYILFISLFFFVFAIAHSTNASENQSLESNFTVKVSKYLEDRSDGLKVGDKVYIESIFSETMVTKAYLNSIELDLVTDYFDTNLVINTIYYTQTIYFEVPQNARDGNLIIRRSDGETENLGIIDIYEPPIDCSIYGEQSYYWEQKGECTCSFGYQWNNSKTYCVAVDYFEEKTPGLTDSDADGVPDNQDFFPYTKSEIINQNYSFSYGSYDGHYGEPVNIQLNIPKDLYLYYQNQNHVFSEEFTNITSFVTYDDLVIKDIARQIDQLYKNESLNPIVVLYQLVSQITYVEDEFSIRGWDEYPKYPLETIVERSGDCEDTTFLAAALFKTLNLTEPQLVRFDDHLGLAAFVNENDDGSKDIFYIETTGNGTHRPGIMPDELLGKPYTLHALDEYKRVKYVEEPQPTNTPVTDVAPTFVVDSKLQGRLKGYILLQVESHGEAWYVNPSDQKRYYMRDGSIAYEMMRSFGLGITDADLSKIPVAKTTDEIQNASSICGSNATANRLKGKILLQVQQHGEAYYVYPKNCRMIYMKDGAAAYEIMRYLGLGITDMDLEKIPGA